MDINENHPQSYRSYMFNNFFNHIDIVKKNIHILNGNANDKELECKLYEEKILKYGGIDLFVGGILNFFYYFNLYYIKD